MSEIRITVFDDVFAKTKKEHGVTISQLADGIKKARATAKTQLPLLKLAKFGNVPNDKSCLRHDDNILEIDGIEGDYDGERIPFDTAVETLRRAAVTAIVYTSPSHTPEKPRWRVLCPFSIEMQPDRRDGMMNRLNGLFGGIFAGESWTLSQSYYYGAVNADYRVEIVTGRPIDLCDELDATAQGKVNGVRVTLTKPAVDGPAILVESLSDWVRELVVESKSEGRKVKQRGPQCWNVVRHLHRERYSQAQITELAERYPDGVFGKYEGRLVEAIGRVWAKLDAPVLSNLPIIKLDVGKHEENARAGLAALADAPYYQRSGLLVKVMPVKGKAWDGKEVTFPAIGEVTLPLLAGLMSDAAYWEGTDRDGDAVRKPAPDRIVKMAMNMPADWPFPVLRGVIGTPTLRPDGSLLTTPGYDPATGFFLNNPPAMPAIPDRPSKEEGAAALALLDALLDEFPFVFDPEKNETAQNNPSRSVALSGFLTTGLRPALDLVPLHGLSAPAAGTGKSYLIDTISMLAYGDRAAVIAQSSNEDETEKRLVAAALSGRGFIPIDNCSKPLSGDFLCQVTERPMMTLRPLGTSEDIIINNIFTVFANGNNLEIMADQVRRTIMCWMDAKLENPEEREFKKAPLEEVKQNRGKYIAAVLTVARAYVCAGMPEKKSYSSYDPWSWMVRSPLIWLGRDDPVAGMEQIRAEDPERVKRDTVFDAWPEGGRAYSTGALVELAMKTDYSGRYVNPDLHDALYAVAAGNRSGEISPERLTKWLNKHAGGIAMGMLLSREKGPRGRPKWMLSRAFM